MIDKATFRWLGNRKALCISIVFICILSAFCTSISTAEQKKFKPTIKSLKKYECPKWFRDAKFGIYLHWGVYSVAERGEWYPRRMYIEGTSTYKHHIKTYGHPSEFGYKDFIPMWKAKNFEPEKLVALFKKAGARYFTPCAVHCDNFDLWNSKHHKYNSVNMGPHKDITGMWRKAAIKHGLRFGCTTHLARSYSWFQVNKDADKSGPYKAVPYDGANPKYQDFYHPPSEDKNYKHPRNPPMQWRKDWAARIKDLIENYKLDFLYFDGSVPFQGEDQGKTGFEVIAHFYNQNIKRHNGRQEGVLTIKHLKDHGIYVDGIATLDIERHRAEELMSEPWQTDTSIGPWGYEAGVKYRSTNSIIDELVDIVSKNGNMLLNVPPKADGTLDKETIQILREIGRWFDINGEAIYGTRVWFEYGRDSLRFTCNGDALYVIVLDWPGKSNLLNVPVSALGDIAGRVSEVSLLGHDGKLTWFRDKDGLTIETPDKPTCEHAFSFKVNF